MALGAPIAEPSANVEFKHLVAALSLGWPFGPEELQSSPATRPQARFCGRPRLNRHAGGVMITVLQ